MKRELDYCAPVGLPLSQFRSWAEADRRWALAWQLDRDMRLPCGCHPEDTTGTDNAGRFTAEPERCHRHKAIGDVSEAYSRSADGPADSQHGIFYRTRKVD